jgi:hypothetical protein
VKQPDARLTRLEGARALAVYLLSVHAVVHAQLAWRARSAWDAAEWAVTLWGALLLGEWLGPRVEPLVEAIGRGRLRAVAVVGYTALILMAPPLVSGDPSLVAREVALFSGIQALLLLMAESGRGRFGAVENALVLVVLAALRGGSVASLAVLGFLVLLAGLLALEHVLGTLAGYPRAQPPAAGVPLRQAASLVGPVAFVLAVVFALLPPQPYRAAAAALPAPMGVAEVATAYQALTVLGVLGGAGIYAIARLLRRARRSGEAPLPEAIEARPLSEEPVEEPELEPSVAYRGRRGRVVRAYVSFLRQAARLAQRRRPSQTPAEYAAALGQPAELLARLTRIFVAARYGPDEPGEPEAREAERTAQAIVTALRRPRGARRPPGLTLPPASS